MDKSEELGTEDTISKKWNWLWYLFLFGLLIFGFKLIDIRSFNNEITEYPALCKDKVEYGNCPRPEYTLNKTTYKVLPERQEVLAWSEVSSYVDRYTKCAVKDLKNWTCSYDDESGTFGFTNGKYWNIANKSMSSTFGLDLDSRTYYVSRLEWLSIQCKSDKYPYIFCMSVVILLD